MLGKAKITEVAKIVVIFMLWIISAVYSWKYGSSWIVFGNPFKYVLWFAVGLQYDYILQRCDIFKSKIINWILLLVLGALILIHKLYFAGVFKMVTEQIIIPLIAIFLLYYWSERIANVFKNKKILEKLSGISFGIYLWAEPLNYYIMHYVVERYGINSLGNNVVALGIYLTRIIGTVVIATLITVFLKKIKFPIKAY